MAGQQLSGKGIVPQNVTIPEHVSDFYANYLQVAVTDWDFMLMFGSIMFPSSMVAGKQRIHPGIRIDAIVRMSPQQAKATLRSLNKAINDYETKYGEIHIPPEELDANATKQ